MFVLYDSTLFEGKERGYFDKRLYPHWVDSVYKAYPYNEDEYDEAVKDAELWNKAEGYNLKVVEIE